MKSIYIGVCKTRDDKRYKESFQNFTDSICGYYSVCQMVVLNEFLPDAQNKIAKDFIQSGYDYLLLLDDDHWGHTKEMLDCLIEANTPVATMKTYSRHYPYVVAAWDRIGHNAMVPIEHHVGYRACDLTGFPMTLIDRSLFNNLEQPYFRAVEAEGREWNTDIDFFERLSISGIKPVVCYQHCLNHDKITQENFWIYRNEEKNNNNNIAWFNILKEISN